MLGVCGAGLVEVVIEVVCWCEVELVEVVIAGVGVVLEVCFVF